MHKKTYNTLMKNEFFAQNEQNFIKIYERLKNEIPDYVYLNLFNKIVTWFSVSKDLSDWDERVTTLIKLKNSSTQTEERFIAQYGKIFGQNKWKEYRASIAMTKENMIKKYGEIEGLKKWNAYCRKQSVTNTFEYKQSVYGWTQDDFDAYNKTRSITLENCIARHGEEQGTLIFENYKKKQQYSGCAKEYFIEKYGIEAGVEKWKEVNRKKARTLENFIIENGQDLGIKKYFEYRELNNHLQPKSYSEISKELFSAVEKRIGNTLFYAENEISVFLPISNTYAYLDCYEKNSNKCIEFNGDYWHANPSIYEKDTVLKYPNNNIIKASDKWQNDKNRIDAIKRELGCEILVIWEHDYLQNKKDVIDLCVKFLEEK